MKMYSDRNLAISRLFAFRVFVLTGLLLCQIAGVAQTAATASNPSRLTVERIFAGREFQPSGFGGFRWLKEGNTYARFEPSAAVKGSQDLVRYQIETNARDVLLSAEKLIPKGATTPLAIHGYDWSTDGGRLLTYPNPQKDWRL